MRGCCVLGHARRVRAAVALGVRLGEHLCHRELIRTMLVTQGTARW
jgi:hypothetical protein